MRGATPHYITYRAMITGDQQHACQAARWRDAARSFVQPATAGSVGAGVRKLLDGLKPHEVTKEHGAA